MINQQLIDPKSIVIVGGSSDVHKPGGNVLKNLINGRYAGELYVLNPKGENIQGQQTFNTIDDLPQVELAIIAIAARYCTATIEQLASTKNTKAFIMISAGFSEVSEAGKIEEHKILDIVNNAGASLIGPNCIGIINPNYHGVFTAPIPPLDPKGCDLISSSGGTAVYLFEEGIGIGLKFSSVFTVGNSTQIGVEDVLEHLDKTYDPATSSQIKLLYIESIRKPKKLLQHASSLIRKGCKIAAIKAGGSEAGKRAASSHTGALAKDDLTVHALLRKAGIVRCYSREELVHTGCIFMHKTMTGPNVAIITHAGGPGVMLSDALSKSGLNVPAFTGNKAQELLQELDPGSSVANPIDFIATGTAEQLGTIIDYCENDFDNVDAMCVIYGNPGLHDIGDMFKVITQKREQCHKPIYAIHPSIINARDGIKSFIDNGGCSFPDEVTLGLALGNMYNTMHPQEEFPIQPKINEVKIRSIVEKAPNGYLSPQLTQELLDATGIPRAAETVTSDIDQAVEHAHTMGYPIAMKVVGPIHKTDVKGVVLNVTNDRQLSQEFERMMKIPDTKAILLQAMLSGVELYVGAKNEAHFGHMVICGLGGIFIEVMNDVAAALTPLSPKDAWDMISCLRSQKIIEGMRGQQGINKALYADIVSRVSALCLCAPEIFEMDINPLLAHDEKVVAVDARIRIEK